MATIEIDLSESKGRVASQIVRACERHGFFTVVNHGVPQDLVQALEQESILFFNQPMYRKMGAGPDGAKPYGYGCNTIGPSGDVGRLEYLTLSTNPNSPQSIREMSQLIPDRPQYFGYSTFFYPFIYFLFFSYSTYVRSVEITLERKSYACMCEFNVSKLVWEFDRVAASEYAKAVRKLTCTLLGLTARGLGLPTASILTDLIKNNQSDSILRINHYPPSIDDGIGFGEHSDPQIFTLLRSNDVPGLQIREGNRWIPVTPNPSAFCVFVGDTLHVRNCSLSFYLSLSLSLSVLIS